MSSSELKKTETNPLVFKQKLAEIKQSKHPAIEIYTDGSKDNNKVAAAAVINHDVPPRWRRGRAFASHAGDRGSIPSGDRPKSKKQVATAPLPNALQ